MKDKDGTAQELKVNDRRRFDEDGNERDSFSDSTHTAINSSVSELGASNPGGDHTATVGGQSDDPQGITFGSFVMSFAHQALMQLGEIPPPPGLDLPKDREAARQTIDIISMLEVKTRGNLEPGEQRLITEVLHNLRMCFVKKV
jgi:hypothetical protein